MLAWQTGRVRACILQTGKTKALAWALAIYASCTGQAGAQTLLSQPRILAPELGSTTDSSTVTLRWQPVRFANRYRVAVGRHPQDLEGGSAARCDRCDLTIEVTGTSFDLKGDWLTHGNYYYWWVQAVGVLGVRSYWSSSWFRLGTSQFTWPTDPANAGSGTLASCGDGICYTLAGSEWRDAQPFLRAPNPQQGGEYHLGADWNWKSGNADLGKPVHAVGDGVILDVERRGDEWGDVVYIVHHTPWRSITSMYAHLHPPAGGLPIKGTTVRKGEIIGVIGDGNGKYAEREHLHFEIRLGESTGVGEGYIAVHDESWCADRHPVSRLQSNCPQRQIDPNAFIERRR